MAGATLSSQRDFQSVMVVPSGRTLARWAAQSPVPWRSAKFGRRVARPSHRGRPAAVRRSRAASRASRSEPIGRLPPFSLASSDGRSDHPRNIRTCRARSSGSARSNRAEVAAQGQGGQPVHDRPTGQGRPGGPDGRHGPDRPRPADPPAWRRPGSWPPASRAVGQIGQLGPEHHLEMAPVLQGEPDVAARPPRGSRPVSVHTCASSSPEQCRSPRWPRP